MRQAWCGLPILVTVLIGACIDWGDPNMSTTSSASSTDTDEDDCDDLCAEKAEGCGASEDLAQMHCSTFCAESDAVRLECLEAASCRELSTIFASGGDVCDEAANDDGDMCIEVGAAGCDPLAGVGCCDAATCESSTGRCCLPANQPQLSCTSNGQCCGNATCQVDPNDTSKRYCR